MDDVVGQGTLLAGRYRLLQPIASDLAGATAWDANDRILDRAVRVAILLEGNVPQALDAARRAALVTDRRVVRVLDVGEDENVAYMVTEPVSGPSLAQLVARGPLPADQARAIVGEAASALEAARRRGVHHLALRPSVLHLTPDDGVLLTGLAVDGALLGRGLGDARSTTRADTVGLVALLYAALTGRWPGATFDADQADGTSVPRLPAAPLLEDGPVAPSDLVAGVPNDLDTLCAVTLGRHDDGPHSPAELILELEPWGDIRGMDLLATAKPPEVGPTTAVIAVVPLTPPAPVAPPVAPLAVPHTVQRQSVRSSFASQPPSAATRPGTPPPAVPGRPSAYGTAAAVGSAAAAAAVAAAAAAAATAQAEAEAEAAAAQAAQAQAAQAQATEAHAAQAHAAEAHAARTAAAPPTFEPAATRRPAPPPPAAADATTVLPQPRPSAARPAPQQHPNAFDDLVGSHEPMGTKRFDPTKLVLAIVAVALLIGLYLAFSALTQPAGSTPRTDSGPRPTVSSAAAQSATPSRTQDSSAKPASGTIAIASGEQIDPPPQGANNQHPEAVPLAIDGDPATFWMTMTFKSANFGGLRQGLGYGVTLAQKSTVRTVTLQINGTGGRVEVRSTAASTPDQGTILAQGALGPNTVLKLSTPTKTQHLVLWFTSLPQTPEGKNRIELDEIGLS